MMRRTRRSRASRPGCSSFARPAAVTHRGRPLRPSTQPSPPTRSPSRFVASRGDAGRLASMRVFAGRFAGYWRDGKRVVLDRNAVLPDRCIKCNEPANGDRRMVKLSYVPTSRELMFGAWAYLSAKRAQIEIGLCEQHRRSRAVTVALGSLAVILASIIVFTQVRATDITLPLLATAGLIGGVIGLIYAAVAGRLVRAAKITDTHIWLKGAGEPFLASLPNAPAVGADGALPTLTGTTAI